MDKKPYSGSSVKSANEIIKVSKIFVLQYIVRIYFSLKLFSIFVP